MTFSFSTANTPAIFRKVPPSPSKTIARKISTNAEKVLDAPAYIDDYCEFLLYISLFIECMYVNTRQWFYIVIINYFVTFFIWDNVETFSQCI